MTKPTEKKITIAEFGVSLRLTETRYGEVKMIATYNFPTLPKVRGGVEWAAALFTIDCNPKSGKGKCVITSPTIDGEIVVENGINEAIITAAQHGRVWAQILTPYTAVQPRIAYTQKAQGMENGIRKKLG